MERHQQTPTTLDQARPAVERITQLHGFNRVGTWRGSHLARLPLRSVPRYGIGQRPYEGCTNCGGLSVANNIECFRCGVVERLLHVMQATGIPSNPSSPFVPTHGLGCCLVRYLVPTRLLCTYRTVPYRTVPSQQYPFHSLDQDGKPVLGICAILHALCVLGASMPSLPSPLPPLPLPLPPPPCAPCRSTIPPGWVSLPLLKYLPL